MTKKEVTQLSYDIVGCAIKVHKNLGPGLLENIYEKCLAYELEERGYKVEQQVIAPIIYGKLLIETPLRLDLLVEKIIIVELKTVAELLPVYKAQLLTYMKLLEIPQGLLITFYTDNITKSFLPMVNEFFEMLPEQ